MEKRGFEFSFGWIFAIIVGAAIIFLAVYATVKIIGTERYRQDSELAKELGIILGPVETILESGKTAKIKLPVTTRLFNECDSKLSAGIFGTQKIGTATKSGIGKEWEKPGEFSSFKSKYIFSSNIVEGDSYLIFAIPLNMPFKIADLIYILSDEYCFVNPPREVEEEIKELGLDSIKIEISVNKCSSRSKKICFSNTGCDIDVALDADKFKGSVKRKFSEIVYFEGEPLLYGAIFAEPKIYECQLKRLMRRASELAGLYRAKSVFLTPKGCASNLELELGRYNNGTINIENSLKIRDIAIISDEIKRRNDELACKLF